MEEEFIEFDVEIEIRCPHSKTCLNYEAWKCFNEFVEVCSTKFVLDLSNTLENVKGGSLDAS